ncbi:hypothetical protein B0I35DRAFT_427370 [Stachybotrys elegans]|uniref:Cellobiose dehydrogenase-like cytochrome domain-containing protein n=1 Tax=Stachybotrys elegans TaxID=80388 RepID=A0A8K0T011_9HYPO|nr:hypothetical protein B0I35DRAFT_427370 [Stachybotrys elegans]
MTLDSGHCHSSFLPSCFFILHFASNLLSQLLINCSDDRSSFVNYSFTPSFYRFFFFFFFVVVLPNTVIMKFSTSASLAAMLYATSVVADHPIDGEAVTAAAAPAVSCRNNICYSWVVPETTASSESGPVYFQIVGPTTFSWIGMGTGTGMADGNMFLIYQDGQGNVTVSHRQASGHSMPMPPQTGAAEMELLSGSGVQDGWMIANIRCDNCATWKSTMALNFTSAGTPMFGAWMEGDSMDSTDPAARIGKHTGNVRIFDLDLASAQVATAGNPFVGPLALPANLTGGAAGNATGGADDDSASTRTSAMLATSVGLAALVAAFQLF